jgi:hypothetical protein
VKLTEKQREALQALASQPITIQMWGGRVHSGMPRGFRLVTFGALKRINLVKSKQTDNFSHTYSITPDGRAALASTEGEKR